MTRHLLSGLCLLLLCLSSARAQEYRNLSNARFNTVASGPMQALIVDVPGAADATAVRQALARRVNAARQVRDRALSRQIEYLRRVYGRDLTPAIPDIVFIRRQGRLALPPAGQNGRADNVLTFNVPLTTAANDGGWTVAQQAELVNIVNKVYTELVRVYGLPSWTGTVKVTNGDNIATSISDRYALSGGIYNVSGNEIIFRRFQSAQSTILSLTQMMALAFHGPASISYDAWERGMARAATLVTVDNLVGAGKLTGVDVADPLWHALDRYDLLNQPPLGNDRFFPASKANEPLPDSSIAGMLYPRLQMSGSAWLKVATEDLAFFSKFNTAYYAEQKANANIKNSVPDLKRIAKAALAGGQVEGLDFLDWYERQYVLDTSVTPGVKLYAWETPLRPEAAADDDFAYAIVLIYYQTTLGAGGSDEVPLSGTDFPIYWDFNFTNRLSLGLQYDRVDIGRPVPGEGSVAPTFFNTIGDNNGQMRVTMDFPVNFENTRLYTAPRLMGKLATPSNFWGAVVGLDTGTVRIEADGLSASTPLKLGAFGAQIDATFFSRLRKATVIVLNESGTEVLRRRVNTGYNEYNAVLYVDDPVETRDNKTAPFPAGPAMISFPIQPLRPKATEALLDPNATGDVPLFNEGNLLLAQWRQNLATEDKYLRYPTLGYIEPGKGYWSNFAQATAVKIKGRVANADQDFSLGLLFGWNQIGVPYDTPVVAGDLLFEQHTDLREVSDLAQALAKGWIGQNVPGIGVVAVWKYDPAQGYVPVLPTEQLQPWRGYWVRVLLSEGLTITWPNPSGRSRAALLLRSKSRAPLQTAQDGWAVPLVVRGPDGRGATAYLGQSPRASAGFDAPLDVQRPPEFTRAVPTVAFPHPEWGASAGDYFADIRRPGAPEPWELTVYTPEPDKAYTLTWPDLRGLPRTTRLLLEDLATGKKQYLQGASGYTFTPGNTPVRRFRIHAEERMRGSLRVLNVVTRPSRSAGGAVQIAFDLTAAATVTTEIRSADGRMVRRLSPGRAASAGTNNLLWDAKNEQAASVPAGTYIVQITARTPEGDTARVVAPVLVLR